MANRGAVLATVLDHIPGCQAVLDAPAPEQADVATAYGVAGDCRALGAAAGVEAQVGVVQ